MVSSSRTSLWRRRRMVVRSRASTWAIARFSRSSSRRHLWDHRQQQVGRPLAACIQRVAAGVVVGVVVHVGSTADTVTRLHVEPDAMALAEHHRGRPDLDLHLDDLAGHEELPPLVAMIRAILQRQVAIELTM